MQIFDNQQR